MSSKCLQCGRARYYSSKYCQEHYRLHRNLPEAFAKMKEREVRDFVSVYMCENWQTLVTWNRKLPGTNLIPDLFFTFRGALVLIEVDEYAHGTQAYTLSDPSRLGQVKGLADSYRRVFLIRLNPDEYSAGPAIWKVKRTLDEETGEVVEEVEENYEEKQKRFQILRETLREIIMWIVLASKKSRHFVESDVEVIKLFYT